MTKVGVRGSRSKLWGILGLLALFIVSDVSLFSWLIFQTISQRELDRVLLETRREAQDLAGRNEGSAEQTGGDLFTAVALAQETQTYIDSVLRQRQIVQTVEITDKNGILVMKERRETEIAAPAPADSVARREVSPGAPRVQTRTIDHQESKPVALSAPARHARRDRADRRSGIAAHRDQPARDGAADHRVAARSHRPDGVDRRRHTAAAFWASVSAFSKSKRKTHSR